MHSESSDFDAFDMPALLVENFESWCDCLGDYISVWMRNLPEFMNVQRQKILVNALSPFMFGVSCNLHPFWLRVLHSYGLIEKDRETKTTAFSEQELKMITLAVKIFTCCSELVDPKNDLRTILKFIYEVEEWSAVTGSIDMVYALQKATDLEIFTRMWALIKRAHGNYKSQGKVCIIYFFKTISHHIVHYSRDGLSLCHGVKTTVEEQTSTEENKTKNKVKKEQTASEALESYTLSIRAAPFCSELYHNRALTYIELKIYRSALSDLKRAIVLDHFIYSDVIKTKCHMHQGFINAGDFLDYIIKMNVRDFRNSQGIINLFEDFNIDKTFKKFLALKELDYSSHGIFQEEADTCTGEEKFNLHLHKGFNAIISSQYGQAVSEYQQALDMIEKPGNEKILLQQKDLIVLMYALCISCIKSGSFLNLQMAIIKLNSVIGLECTDNFPAVYLGLGQAYKKLNRYCKAMDVLTDGLKKTRGLSEQRSNCLCYWPKSEELIPETKLEILEELIKDALLDIPMPDTYCKFHTDVANSHREIYITDPDSKGFVRFECQAKCCLAFHIACYKSFEQNLVVKHIGKEMLDMPCPTPDCCGQIHIVQMYKPENKKLLEWISSAQPVLQPPRPKRKTKTESPQKLQKKMERKILRKERKNAAKMMTENEMEELPPIETAQTHLYLYKDEEPRHNETLCQDVKILQKDKSQVLFEGKDKYSKTKNKEKKQKQLIQLDFQFAGDENKLRFGPDCQTLQNESSRFCLENVFDDFGQQIYKLLGRIIAAGVTDLESEEFQELIMKHLPQDALYRISCMGGIVNFLKYHPKFHVVNDRYATMKKRSIIDLRKLNTGPNLVPAPSTYEPETPPSKTRDLNMKEDSGDDGFQLVTYRRTGKKKKMNSSISGNQNFLKMLTPCKPISSHNGLTKIKTGGHKTKKNKSIDKNNKRGKKKLVGKSKIVPIEFLVAHSSNGIGNVVQPSNITLDIGRPSLDENVLSSNATLNAAHFSARPLGAQPSVAKLIISDSTPLTESPAQSSAKILDTTASPTRVINTAKPSPRPSDVAQTMIYLCSASGSLTQRRSCTSDIAGKDAASSFSEPYCHSLSSSGSRVTTDLTSSIMQSDHILLTSSSKQSDHILQTSSSKQSDHILLSYKRKKSDHILQTSNSKQSDPILLTPSSKQSGKALKTPNICLPSRGKNKGSKAKHDSQQQAAAIVDSIGNSARRVMNYVICEDLGSESDRSSTSGKTGHVDSKKFLVDDEYVFGRGNDCHTHSPASLDPSLVDYEYEFEKDVNYLTKNQPNIDPGLVNPNFMNDEHIGIEFDYFIDIISDVDPTLMNEKDAFRKKYFFTDNLSSAKPTLLGDDEDGAFRKDIVLLDYWSCKNENQTSGKEDSSNKESDGDGLVEKWERTFADPILGLTRPAKPDIRQANRTEEGQPKSSPYSFLEKMHAFSTFNDNECSWIDSGINSPDQEKEQLNLGALKMSTFSKTSRRPPATTSVTVKEDDTIFDRCPTVDQVTNTDIGTHCAAPTVCNVSTITDLTIHMLETLFQNEGDLQANLDQIRSERDEAHRAGEMAQREFEMQLSNRFKAVKALQEQVKTSVVRNQKVEETVEKLQQKLEISVQKNELYNELLKLELIEKKKKNEELQKLKLKNMEAMIQVIVYSAYASCLNIDISRSMATFHLNEISSRIERIKTKECDVPHYLSEMHEKLVIFDQECEQRRNQALDELEKKTLLLRKGADPDEVLPVIISPPVSPAP